MFSLVKIPNLSFTELYKLKKKKWINLSINVMHIVELNVMGLCPDGILIPVVLVSVPRTNQWRVAWRLQQAQDSSARLLRANASATDSHKRMDCRAHNSSTITCMPPYSFSRWSSLNLLDRYPIGRNRPSPSCTCRRLS